MWLTKKNMRGSKKPDIYFESKRIKPFVADITSISDDSYEKENPISYFRECLEKFFRNADLTLKGVSINVGDIMVGDYGDRKLKLALPEKKNKRYFSWMQIYETLRSKVFLGVTLKEAFLIIFRKMCLSMTF